MPDSETIYQLQNVSKRYNTRSVVAVHELTLARGEMFALVGPSGAGKSTLLRLLAFLEAPTEGVIEFEGQMFDRRTPLPLETRRRVAMVFQRPILLNASVWDNVAFGLRIRAIRDTHDRVGEALARVGLQDFARANARSLSGGEMQRVALARALIIQPDVLLLDEPTANLDPYNVSLIEGIVKELHTAQGTTIVLVTHNVFQARRLAQRAGLLLEGRLVEVAPAREFFETPRDPRTRAFVDGEMIY
jgi:tungstate transport system ATP-binding protein